MQQVLFTIPILKDWFPPDGFSIPSFGAMLFLAFITTTVWGSRRAARVGMKPDRFQDMIILLFITGIAGARLLYMIQFAHQFPDKSPGALIVSFFQIWKGGIIFYGSALGGALGYGLFYWFILRRLKINGWQLADAVAPLLALGLAIGRIGCYLNGCCWGQVANEVSCPVPLGSAHFPLLPAHSRDQLVSAQALQTSTGFTLAPRSRLLGTSDDPRSLVASIEPLSPAHAAGLQPGDRITGVNGVPNAIVLELSGATDKTSAALDLLKEKHATIENRSDDRPARAVFSKLEDYQEGRRALVEAGLNGLVLTVRDTLGEMVREWPRNRSELQLAVLRDGKTIELSPFTPRTVGLYPTQLYETVSMVLLIALLLAYYPFRSHDGELMVLVMVGYAIHRFIDESLRTEPLIAGTPLTLSQWGSVVILAGAVVMEIIICRTTPSRWRKPPGPAAETSPPPAIPA